MDTLRDIWASLVAGVQERTTNPLTFSFIASWCLWNFKFFFILAGDGTTAERLNAVDALYPVAWSTYVGHAFGAPLASALVYVFVYPKISAFVIERYRTQQVLIANTVRKIEGERVITVEESSKLIRRHEVERAAWEKMEEELQEQVRTLRDLLNNPTMGALVGMGPEQEEEKKEEDTTSPDSSTNVTQRIGNIALPSSSATSESINEHLRVNDFIGYTDEERKLLVALSKSNIALSWSDLSLRTSMSTSTSLATLERLAERRLIRRIGADRWELTPKGHAAVVNGFTWITKR